MSAPAIHLGHIHYAMLQYLDWSKQLVMFEWEVDGGRADIVSLSAAGYLTEFEVKTSLADFKADRAKAKWAKHRPHVSRFFYVVPGSLIPKVQPLLLPGQGLIDVHWGNNGGGAWHTVFARERVAAERVKATKYTPVMRQQMHANCYYRYWHAQSRRMQEKFTVRIA